MCEDCLARDPAAAAAPVPFEGVEGSAMGRLWRTLGTAMSPARSAPAFATGDIASALRFCLWTALPLSFLSGIIPYTHTLMFGDFRVVPIGSPGAEEITLDIARAGGIQIVLAALHLLAYALPFTSLMRAYGGQWAYPAAWRVLLYRFWLLPAGMLLFMLAVWGAPAAELPVPDAAELAGRMPPVQVVLADLARTAGQVLLLLSMGFTARLAAGVRPGWTLVVVIVAAMVAALVDMSAADALRAVWPAP